ncbi:MAG TPA: hypothetical protein VGS06_09320 [Streptosporangiaceae bacterium]|nr:hypothetical protein [Streptosporangiaceae bacterium]
MIAAHIMIQAREVPGVWETASVAGPCDVIFWAGTRDPGQLARMVTSRARAPGGGTRAGGGPVVYR